LAGAEVCAVANAAGAVASANAANELKIHLVIAISTANGQR
jgi:hypothetical protein